MHVLHNIGYKSHTRVHKQGGKSMNIKNVGIKCVGCSACANICPVGAIKMQKSDDGFLYPHINTKKCINCGMCTSVCPAMFSGFRPKTDCPKCYAAYSDDKNAMRSSSGGIFGILAESVLSDGGYVCGAAFNSDWDVQHIIISSVDDLDKLRVSKYVQSNTNNVYVQIKNLLDDGKRVLFSGTPCQVAGLYGFLRRDYDKLLTCDIFCHGAPSPMVWRRYIQDIANGRKIININFRDKEHALNNPSCPYNVTFYFDNGDCVTRPYPQYEYMNGFLQNLYLRKSCATCKFATTPRTSDITLGDFWGYERIDKRRNIKRGISAVLINTPRGADAFDNIRKSLSFVRPVKLSDIVRGNPVLARPCAQHKNREKFINDFNTCSDSVADIITKNLDTKDVAIMNFSSKTDCNYGASLVGYAMERAVQNLGYNPSTICFIPDPELYRVSNRHVFWQFQQRFLNTTGICTNKESLQNNINEKFDKFIIGSDQVVRHPWHNNFAYYLDWVYGNKALLAYAPSFGISETGMNSKLKRYAKRCLKRFDALSVREHSGSDIMRNEFGIDDVPVVCDPTMLLTASEYQPIIDADKFDLPKTEYVAYYMLDASPNVLRDLGKSYILVDAYRDENGNFRPIGQWLDIIKNAKYVVTDSFHGTVFSMIFEKQFITLKTYFRGNDRIDTLMKLVGHKRLVDASDIISERRHFAKKINYTNVSQNISRARKRGYDFLQSALSISPTYKSPMVKYRRSHHHSFWWHLRHMRF